MKKNNANAFRICTNTNYELHCEKLCLGGYMTSEDRDQPVCWFSTTGAINTLQIHRSLKKKAKALIKDTGWSIHSLATYGIKQNFSHLGICFLRTEPNTTDFFTVKRYCGCPLTISFPYIVSLCYSLRKRKWFKKMSKCQYRQDLPTLEENIKISITAKMGHFIQGHGGAKSHFLFQGIIYV